MRYAATIVGRACALALGAAMSSAPVWAMESSQGALQVERIVGDLDQPWGVEFLPDGTLLITERDGALVAVAPDGARWTVANVPKVVARGQGGLLDVMVPRDFKTSREIFLSLSHPQKRGSGTAIVKVQLSDNYRRIEKSRVIFQQAQGFGGSKHFGSRIVEARDGTVFLTIGDRGDRKSAQDLTNHNGTVVRVRRSGVSAADNPFIGRVGAEPEIYSYGHRNPQGAALDLNGDLWVVEHGARGGDEVNKIKPGANYGWPVISYGRHYSGFKIGEGTEKPGMEQPVHYWDPSIAPSGMMIYSGKLWPEWRGDIFVGSLKFDLISRLDTPAMTEERLQSPETGRVRDVMEGPDGAIWFLSVDNGALYRVTPAPAS